MTERTCSVPACTKRAKSRGWCTTHYERWRRTGDVAASALDLRKERPARFCDLGGCEKPHYSKGMCKSHYRADYYRQNGGRERAGNAAWRSLNRPESTGRRPRSGKSTAERWHEWWEANKEVRNELRRTLYAADPEPHRERQRQYRLRHPDGYKRWRAANPVRWALINRENQRRRRRVNGQRVSFQAVLARDGMVCHLCTLPIAGLSDLHFDHVVPLARGGAHSMANLKPAHAECNLRKGAKLVGELDWVVIRG